MEYTLDEIIKRGGGPSALARAIGGLTSQAVCQWTRVPAERVHDVERATGIPRSKLRPDLYPAEREEGAAA